LENETKKMEKPDEFKVDGKILSHILAKKIMSRHTFITTTDNEETLVYNGGVFHQEADTLIKELAEGFVSDITQHHINEIIGHVKRNTYISRSEINNTTHKIHLQNGIYNLEKMELEEFTPDIISTIEIPVKYLKTAKCPAIKKFLKEILADDDIKMVQEAIGYCLLKDYPLHKAFMFIGEGANGKSTLLNLIKTFLGEENVSGVSLQDLVSNRFASSQLYGKLGNIHADLSDKSLQQTGIFKMVTGADMITADKKFRDPFKFTNFAKMFFSTNKLPETTDDSNAFFRRWCIINFPKVFEGKDKDPHILKKLTTEKELSGLFNWSIEGLKRLLEQGEFSGAVSTDELRDVYERLSSPLKAFVKISIAQDSQGFITKEEFYAHYVKYCRDMKMPIKAKNVVGRDLPAFLPYIRTEKRKIGKTREHCWAGIRFEAPQNRHAVQNRHAQKSALNQYAAQAGQDVHDFPNFKSIQSYKYKMEKNLDILDIPDTLDISLKYLKMKGGGAKLSELEEIVCKKLGISANNEAIVELGALLDKEVERGGLSKMDDEYFVIGEELKKKKGGRP